MRVSCLRDGETRDWKYDGNGSDVNDNETGNNDMRDEAERVTSARVWLMRNATDGLR
jgi:hypothetical protein